MLLPLTNALWIVVCLAFVVGPSGGLEWISAANEDVQIQSQIAAVADDYVDLDPVRIHYLKRPRNNSFKSQNQSNKCSIFDLL
jgi:hypothetical protein